MTVTIPGATYRLQAHVGFGFNAIREIVPYLADLGVTHIYSSPILRARRGSTHGYDVVDATELNPELGTEEEFAGLVAAMREHGLGLLLDIVPNHMAASPENAWWTSLLENGPRSRFINYFDIDWERPAKGSLPNRIVLPVLGRPYGEALEEQELQLDHDEQGFFIRYFDRRFPLAPHSYPPLLSTCLERLVEQGLGESATATELRDVVRQKSGVLPPELDGVDDRVLNSRFIKDMINRLVARDQTFATTLRQTIDTVNGQRGRSESFDALDALLDQQWYRLAFWRIASEEINYRRFFDISDLVGVRVEDPEVFEARHARLFGLLENGSVSGVRIDHIDGLHDPAAHLKRLQLRAAGASATGSASGVYVVVEKILAPGEPLRRSFAVHGTTGYETLNVLNSLFIDEEGLRSLDATYRQLTGLEEDFHDLGYTRKKLVIEQLFTGEMRGLGEHLVALAAVHRTARDFSATDLSNALTEVTASLPVYRTYVTGEIEDDDARYLNHAFDSARNRGTADSRALEFLHEVFFLETPHYAADKRDEWLAFLMRWQQFTGRVTAKGVEDTAFYVFNRLISMNEVGGEPGHFSDPVAQFHAHNERQARDWPHSLVATSTHDTKRSEDLRARINALSEVPDAWRRQVTRWMRTNRTHSTDAAGRTVPDANEQFLIYQTLLGVWPLDSAHEPETGQRIAAFLEKAAREAKTYSSWLEPNHDHEAALARFVQGLLDDAVFLGSFRALQKKLAYHGWLNALSQLVLKATIPGVPDFYQGTETWNFSLVDPDNRRAVDFEARRRDLSIVQNQTGERFRSSMLRQWQDGRIKTYVTHKLLDARRAQRALFERGNYVALRASGTHARSVCAFARTFDRDAVIVIVPRLTSRVASAGKLPVGDVWKDTAVDGNDLAAGSWRNVFTDEKLATPGGLLALGEVLRTFPVAVLLKQQGAAGETAIV